MRLATLFDGSRDGQLVKVSDIGSSCIAERRGIEKVDHGEARTPFMRFDDRVRMEAHTQDGRAPFGYIDQQVVRS